MAIPPGSSTSALAYGDMGTTVDVTAGEVYWIAVTQNADLIPVDPFDITFTGPASGDAVPDTGIPTDFVAPDAPALPGTYSPPSDLERLRRISEIYPAPHFTSGRLTTDWVPTSTTTALWGSFRVVADGTDITNFRGGMTSIGSYELDEPFGDGPATITVSNAVPQDIPGSGDLSWLVPGKSVDIIRLHPAGTATTVKWSGEIIGFDLNNSDDDWSWTVDLTGCLWIADYQVHKPPTFLDPTDIGTVIADDLNKVVSRRYHTLAREGTGITTTQRGSSDDSVLEHVQSLLATATTNDGDGQWTVNRIPGSPRHYRIIEKDRTTQHWTVRAGQPGVSCSLTKDATQAPNVIYGHGVGSDGYAWANWKYPNTNPDAAPGYPFSDPSNVITIGTSDADTDSTTGVSTWQRRVDELRISGAHVTVDGHYSSADRDACKVIQRHYGILIDGIVGPQTWAATFDVGANGADLSGAFRMPLAFDTRVMPRKYNADGSDGGANSAYDSSILRVETDIDYGAGVTKSEGTRAALDQYRRDHSPAWAGTITLAADPNEGCKFDIEPGDNIRVQNWASSAGPLLHIAGIQVDPENLSVNLTVDEHGRDLLNVIQVIQRNRENSTNPARMPTRKLRRSALVSDSIVEFDGESPGGIIPKHALFGGLWTVIRIPVSQLGTVAQVIVNTSSPAAPFTLAFFGAPVTASQMIAHVGEDPLANRDDFYGPYDWDYDNLIDMGFIQAIGGPGQAAGYDPGYQTSPFGGSSTTLTGRLISTGSWTYQSVKPPWLWIAEYSPDSTFIQGRVYPAPEST